MEVHVLVRFVPVCFLPVYVRPQPHRNKEDDGVGIGAINPMLLVRWCPPLPGHFKLNTDGSSLGNPGPSTCGGLIRDCHGNWFCGFVAKLTRGTSLAAEMQGIFMGLCLVKKLRLEKVVVETDCKAAVRLVVEDDGEGDGSRPQGSIFEKCRKLVKQLGCCVVHVRREGNHCADQMAKFARRQSQEIAIVVDPPKMLEPYLEADAAGRWFKRPAQRHYHHN